MEEVLARENKDLICSFILHLANGTLIHISRPGASDERTIAYDRPTLFLFP